eukprot:scaffold1455_cov198-Skeletonema_menzelii.AAC.1
MPPPHLTLQQSSPATRPTSSTNQNVNQNGLSQVLAQAVQQQRLHHDQQQQQQLLQNPLSQLLHTQNPLQPAQLEGVTHQLLVQAQLRQLIYHVQQLILLQHLLNQQNALPPESLTTSLSSSAPSSASRGVLPIPNVASSNYSSTPQSVPTSNVDILHNLQQQLTNPSSNALMLSSMLLNNIQHQPNNNLGILSALEGAQQLDQLQRSLTLQQNNQLPASSAAAANQSFSLQHQSPLLGPLYQAFPTAQLRQIQNSQDPPSTNSEPSSANANAAPASTRQKRNRDEDHSLV